MQVGIQFFPDIGPAEKSARDYWQEALRLVGLVDRYGYSHVRTVEHYFHPYGGYSPNPIVFLAAAAQTQIIVVSHAPLLVEELTAAPLCSHLHLLKEFGETRLQGATLFNTPKWNWPAR